MTDMHREAFEAWSDGYGLCIAQLSWQPGAYQEWLTETAWQGWLAAMRYRDEHHCDCAYTCKFCRDEQEKKA